MIPMLLYSQYCHIPNSLLPHALGAFHTWQHLTTAIKAEWRRGRGFVHAFDLSIASSILRQVRVYACYILGIALRDRRIESTSTVPALHIPTSYERSETYTAGRSIVLSRLHRLTVSCVREHPMSPPASGAFA